MAIQSQPSRISEPFAGSGTKNTIPATNATPSASQAASWASGFPPECSQPISAGGCPVPRNDMNGVLNQISQDYAFRQDGGVWEWSALADYDAGRLVRGSNGDLYYSKTQSGPGTSAGSQNPVSDTAHTYWTQVPSDNDLFLHKAGNEIATGRKTFNDGINFTGTYSGVDLEYILNLNSNGNCGLWDVQENQWVWIASPGGSYSFLGSANTLKTARNIQVDLSSSSASSFDGSANITPGVSGVLSITNGGTGSSTKNFVDLSTNQTVDGNKTFTSNINVERIYPYYTHTVPDVTMGSTPGHNIYCERNAYDSQANRMYVSRYTNDSTAAMYEIIVNYWADKTKTLHLVAFTGTTSFTPQFRTGSDNDTSLGSATRRWSVVYAGTGSINTSDERMKQKIEAIPDDVLDAWGECGFVQFQFNDAVDQKGKEAARLHSGMVAQRIDRAFKAHGLDAGKYGLFCHDEWDAEPERTDKDGNVEVEALPAGDRYSLRYEEALCMEAAYQRRRADRAEARLAALEERLAAIEAKLG